MQQYHGFAHVPLHTENFVKLNHIYDFFDSGCEDYHEIDIDDIDEFAVSLNEARLIRNEVVHEPTPSTVNFDKIFKTSKICPQKNKEGKTRRNYFVEQIIKRLIKYTLT